MYSCDFYMCVNVCVIMCVLMTQIPGLYEIPGLYTPALFCTRHCYCLDFCFGALVRPIRLVLDRKSHFALTFRESCFFSPQMTCHTVLHPTGVGVLHLQCCRIHSVQSAFHQVTRGVCVSQLDHPSSTPAAFVISTFYHASSVGCQVAG